MTGSWENVSSPGDEKNSRTSSVVDGLIPPSMCDSPHFVGAPITDVALRIGPQPGGSSSARHGIIAAEKITAAPSWNSQGYAPITADPSA